MALMMGSSRATRLVDALAENHWDSYKQLLSQLQLLLLLWWISALLIPSALVDGHKCSSVSWPLGQLSLLLGASAVAASVRAELWVVSRLAGEASSFWRWPVVPRALRRQTILQLLFRANLFTDVLFVHIARDCGSPLWWAGSASLVAFFVLSFGVAGMCFAASDCDGNFPANYGFVLLDFGILTEVGFLAV